jgi:hypothetical protein
MEWNILINMSSKGFLTNFSIDSMTANGSDDPSLTEALSASLRGERGEERRPIEDTRRKSSGDDCKGEMATRK